jgi:hypothetical protein
VSFLPDRLAAAEEALGLPAGELRRAGDDWITGVRQACAELGLTLRDGVPDPRLDRLEDMVGEMRAVYQTAPGCW